MKARDKISSVFRSKQEKLKQEKQQQMLWEERLKQQMEQKRLHEIHGIQLDLEKRATKQKHQLEKELWEKKLEAEFELVEKKIAAERRGQLQQVKLPKLQIIPFNGTPIDWVTFENMFSSQVHRKDIPDEVKFGYLLETVNPLVRDKIGNLRPVTKGYETTWERLKREYGLTKVVVNPHMTQMMNLGIIKGTDYERVRKFYEKLSRCYDALQTLDRKDTLDLLVMTTINKLPNVKPDLVRKDDEWEEWSMKDLVGNLEKWLKRSKPGETTSAYEERHEREKNCYSGEAKEKQLRKLTYCDSGHWCDECKKLEIKESRRSFFRENKLRFNCVERVRGSMPQKGMLLS